MYIFLHQLTCTICFTVCMTEFSLVLLLYMLFNADIYAITWLGRRKRNDLDFLAKVPFIPFLHVSMDLPFPFFNREFAHLKGGIFQA